MSLAPSRKSASGQRRCSVGTSGGGGRHSHSDASSIHTYPGGVRAAEGSLAARTHPTTPRRQAKNTSCSDNHGIRPPTPEQYLTPLQQKEVCIRHLRARLRDNVERLQHRDFEVDELRARLYRMQEDWIEEECHRVEAQLALKEARKEIQHLQEVVESVKSNLSVREQDARDGEPHPGPQPAGKSRSCGCSPAGTLSRGAGRTRLSSEALQLERCSNAPESSRASRSGGQTHLLLEAALLSEQPPPPPPGLLLGAPTVPRSSTYERLCSGGTVLPVSHSCHTLSSASCKCGGPAFLAHHHLFLHLPQEEAPATLAPAAVPASDPVATPSPVAERKPEVRSQACSPTMTWLSEDAEELNAISELHPFPPSLTPLSTPEHSCAFAPPPPDAAEETAKTPEEATTCQPQPAASLPVRPEDAGPATGEDGADERDSGDNGDGAHSPQVCHWSRYFLVDLLALAMPVVPTMAWLCRGAPREVLPVYHIGSLLRGCCAVALHSLRRRGADRRQRRDSMNGTTTTTTTTN